MLTTWASQQPGQRGGGGPVPPSNVLTLSTNLNNSLYYIPSRPFTNLATGAPWSPSLNSDPPASTSNVDATGNLISIPAGKTWTKGCRQPDATSGFKQMVLYWEGSATGVTITSGQYAGQSDVDATATNYGPHPKGRVKYFTATWTGSTQYAMAGFAVQCVQASLDADGPPQNVMVCEKAIFDAYFPPAGPNAIPLWHDAYVQQIIDSGYQTIRFMDFMQGNAQYLTNISSLSQTVQSNTLNSQSAFRVFNPGTLAQSLAIGAQVYYFNQAYFNAKTTAPTDPFGANGNSIAIIINAPSGSPSITTDDSVPGEVTLTITPDSGVANPGSASAIAAQITAHATARYWIIPISGIGSGDNAGTTPIGVVPKTFLQYGRYSSAPDGIPVSWMIDLCQRTNTRPWFTPSLRGDQTYWETFAGYVQANYTGSLRPIFEGSNEVWNDFFIIKSYLIAEAAKNGRTFYEEWGARHNQRMQWMRGQCPNGIRMVNCQNANPVVYTSLTAVTDVIANTDAMSTAPYFSHNDTAWTTPTPTTDIVVAADQMELDIPSRISAAVTNKTNATANGHDFYLYEGQQHNTFGAPNLATMQSFQRAPRMRRSMGIWLSELERQAKPVDGVLFIDYATITNTHPIGSFGIKESFVQLDSDAPKYLAMLDAMQGIYPAYFIPGNLPALSSTLVYSGTPVSVNLPTSYNQVGPITYLWRADGGATAGTGATTATYTPAGGDIGKVLTCEVTLTNGTDPWTYTSNASSAVAALTKFRVIRNADLVGGNITLPADWTDNHIIHLIGSGGNGASGTTSVYRNGGGGGASGGANIPGLLPGATIPCVIPLGGSTSLTSFNSGAVQVDYGRAGATTVSTPGVGGSSANNVGCNLYSYSGGTGGSVGTTFRGCGGGGGSGGAIGAGKNGGGETGGGGGGGGGCNGGSSTAGVNGAAGVGGNGGIGSTGTAGGAGSTGAALSVAGTNGSGGGAGCANTDPNQAGANGSQQTVWTDTVSSVTAGPGSGGGGAGSGGAAANAIGGNGGGYGGGGGGRSSSAISSGLGAPGVIVLEWIP